MQLVESLGVPIQEHLDRRIEAGELGLVVRIYANSHEDDDRVMVRVLPVVSADGTLLFDGSDEVTPDPDLVESGFGCGRIADGELQIDVGHGQQPLPCPFCPYSAALLTFHHLQVRGPIRANSSGPLIIGGAVLPEDLRRVFYPDFVRFVNEVIANGGQSADDVVDYFDGNCVELTEHPVCSLYAAGVGECDDTADPPVITATELICNALVHSATRADLDTDDDGLDDMISVGWELSLVPVTVSN